MPSPRDRSIRKPVNFDPLSINRWRMALIRRVYGFYVTKGLQLTVSNQSETMRFNRRSREQGEG